MLIYELNDQLTTTLSNNQMRKTMKTLLILRHAKSSWKDPRLSDHDRPLKKRGRRDAPRMGELLKEEELVPDLIISSTATRAYTTALLVAEACEYEEEIQIEPSLYHGEPDDYIEVLQDVRKSKKCVMVVGHNPGVEELLSFLTDAEEVMPTAALAHITLPIKKWAKLNESVEGKLLNLWRPREL